MSVYPELEYGSENQVEITVKQIRNDFAAIANDEYYQHISSGKTLSVAYTDPEVVKPRKFAVGAETRYLGLSSKGDLGIFSDTSSRPASNIDVATHSVHLLRAIHTMKVQQVSKQSDVETIKGLFEFVESDQYTQSILTGSNFANTVILGGAYQKPYKNNLSLPEILLSPDMQEKLKKYKYAMELLDGRDKFVADLGELAAGNEVEPVKKAIGWLAKDAVKKSVFPNSDTLTAGATKWYPIDTIDQSATVYAKHKNGWWAVSREGNCRELHRTSDNDQGVEILDNPVGLVRRAPAIAEMFINGVIKEVLPQLDIE